MWKNGIVQPVLLVLVLGFVLVDVNVEIRFVTVPGLPVVAAFLLPLAVVLVEREKGQDLFWGQVHLSFDPTIESETESVKTKTFTEVISRIKSVKFSIYYVSF